MKTCLGRARNINGVGIYHVMMRGMNHRAIFDDNEDCHRFMDILADIPFLYNDEDRFYDHMHLCDLCMVSNDESFPLAGDGGGLAY